jgi:hypothetical protein
MRLDKMTSEQRARYEAHRAHHNARSKVAGPAETCLFCEKLIADPFDPAKAQLAGAVVIPFFGYFCSQPCADAFERDFGIQFKRDATGKVSYQ